VKPIEELTIDLPSTIRKSIKAWQALKQTQLAFNTMALRTYTAYFTQLANAKALATPRGRKRNCRLAALPNLLALCCPSIRLYIIPPNYVSRGKHLVHSNECRGYTKIYSV
jgi:hypothetical protein